jgi:V/A-type H+-transporting ATPase subunit K
MEITIGVGLAAIGAGFSMGAAAIGAGIGVGIAGVAGAGVIAEDPKKFGPILVLQALPQTQGIYGFLGAILIMIGTGMLGVLKPVSLELGLVCLGAGIATGLGGITAIGQGITAGACMGAVAKRSETFGQGMVLTVMSETFAVFSLLILILILVGIKLFG